MLAHGFHSRANFIDRGIVLRRAGFLAKPHESGAAQTLELGIFLYAQLLAQLADGRAHGGPAQPGVKIRQLTQTDGSFAARLGIPCVKAGVVIGQDFGR